MSKIRPKEVISADRARTVIENSIESAVDWSIKTKEVFYDLDERLDQLNELMDIIFELSWRYGEENVGFKFSNKKKIPNAISIAEIISTEYWQDRILVVESCTNISVVYINF